MSKTAGGIDHVEATMRGTFILAVTVGSARAEGRFVTGAGLNT
jgi:hypothetical protein